MRMSLFNEILGKLESILDNTTGASDTLIQQFDELNTVGSNINRVTLKEINKYDYSSYNTLYDLLCSNNESHSNLVLNSTFVKYGSDGMEAKVPANMRIYDIAVIGYANHDYGVYGFKKFYFHSQSEKDYEELLEAMKDYVLFVLYVPVSEDEGLYRHSLNILCINNTEEIIFKEEDVLSRLSEVAPELPVETSKKITENIFLKKFPNEIKNHEFFTGFNIMKDKYDRGFDEKDMKDIIPSDLSAAYEYGFFAIIDRELCFFNVHADTDIPGSIPIMERRDIYTRCLESAFDNALVDMVICYELCPEIENIITSSTLNITVFRNTHNNADKENKLYGRAYIGEELGAFMRNKNILNATPRLLEEIKSVIFEDNGEKKDLFCKYSIIKSSYSDENHKLFGSIGDAFKDKNSYLYGYISLDNNDEISFEKIYDRRKNSMLKTISKDAFLRDLNISFLDKLNRVIITFSKFTYREEGDMYDRFGLDIVVNVNETAEDGKYYLSGVTVENTNNHYFGSEEEFCKQLDYKGLPECMINALIHNSVVNDKGINEAHITDILVQKPKIGLNGNPFIWEDCFNYKVIGFTVFDQNGEVFLSADKDLESLNESRYDEAVSIFTMLNFIMQCKYFNHDVMIYGIHDDPKGIYQLRVEPIIIEKGD